MKERFGVPTGRKDMEKLNPLSEEVDSSEQERSAIESRINEEVYLKELDLKISKVDDYLQHVDEANAAIEQWNAIPDNEYPIRYSRSLEVKKGLVISVPLMDGWMSEKTLGDRFDQYYDLKKKYDIYPEADFLDAVRSYVESTYLPMLKDRTVSETKWLIHYGPVPFGSEHAYEQDSEADAVRVSEGFIKDICKKLGY